ncbi:MAG: hypothetical protein ACFFD5_15140 [Candidatus Thorarchaeota archaeon]
MSMNIKAERYRNKKELLHELNLYKSMILKKFKEESYKSALEKVRSALTLLEEYREEFDLKHEFKEFDEISQQISDELNNYKKIFLRRYKNLLKEDLSESNLERFLKLLAMLKEEVDENLEKYNLYELRDNINNYFKYLKKLYTILSSYKVLNFQEASKKILTFGKEIQDQNFPNLKKMILFLYQKLITIHLFEFSKSYDKLTLQNVSERLAIKPEYLLNLIKLIIEQPKTPIKSYNPKTQEIIFKN